MQTIGYYESIEVTEDECIESNCLAYSNALEVSIVISSSHSGHLALFIRIFHHRCQCHHYLHNYRMLIVLITIVSMRECNLNHMTSCKWQWCAAAALCMISYCFVCTYQTVACKHTKVPLPGRTNRYKCCAAQRNTAKQLYNIHYACASTIFLKV